MATGSAEIRGTAAGIAACLIWASAVAVSGTLADRYGAIRSCAYECLIAGLVLLALARVNGSSRGMFSHELKYYLVCGLCWFGNLTLLWLSLGATRSPQEVVLVGACNYLWPVFTFLLSLIFLKRRPGWLLVPGVILAVIGVFGVRLAVIESFSLASLSGIFGNILANSLAICCALSWALYSNYTRALNPDGKPGAVPLFMVGTGLVMGLVALWTPSSPRTDASSLLILVIWSLTSSVAYLSWDMGMKSGNVVTVSTFSILIPLLSTLITCLVNRIAITPGVALSSMALVSGSLLCRIAATERR